MDGNSADHPPEHIHDQLQRPESRDPVEGLSFELPEPDTGRRGLGWFLLTIVLGLLIAGSLAVYFTRNPYEVALRTYLHQAGVLEALDQSERADEILDTAMAKLERR